MSRRHWSEAGTRGRSCYTLLYINKKTEGRERWDVWPFLFCLVVSSTNKKPSLNSLFLSCYFTICKFFRFFFNFFFKIFCSVKYIPYICGVIKKHIEPGDPDTIK